MLDGLAFLPLHLVGDGMRHLRDNVPDELETVVDYFDSNYVSGPFRAVLSEGRLRFRRTPPRFPPNVWNVFQATVTDEARTNNVCESWNHGFKHLVGHTNPSLWSVLECIQKDNAMSEMEIFRAERGLQKAKRERRGTRAHQKVMKRLCREVADGSKSVVQFLDAVGHCIRIHV